MVAAVVAIVVVVVEVAMVVETRGYKPSAHTYTVAEAEALGVSQPVAKQP